MNFLTGNSHIYIYIYMPLLLSSFFFLLLSFDFSYAEVKNCRYLSRINHGNGRIEAPLVFDCQGTIQFVKETSRPQSIQAGVLGDHADHHRSRFRRSADKIEHEYGIFNLQNPPYDMGRFTRDIGNHSNITVLYYKNKVFFDGGKSGEWIIGEVNERVTRKTAPKSIEKFGLESVRKGQNLDDGSPSTGMGLNSKNWISAYYQIDEKDLYRNSQAEKGTGPTDFCWYQSTPQKIGLHSTKSCDFYFADVRCKEGNILVNHTYACPPALNGGYLNVDECMSKGEGEGKISIQTAQNWKPYANYLAEEKKKRLRTIETTSEQRDSDRT